jgi:hypothetical protein
MTKSVVDEWAVKEVKRRMCKRVDGSTCMWSVFVGWRIVDCNFTEECKVFC